MRLNVPFIRAFGLSCCLHGLAIAGLLFATRNTFTQALGGHPEGHGFVAHVFISGSTAASKNMHEQTTAVTQGTPPTQDITSLVQSTASTMHNAASQSNTNTDTRLVAPKTTSTPKMTSAALHSADAETAPTSVSDTVLHLALKQKTVPQKADTTHRRSLSTTTQAATTATAQTTKRAHTAAQSETSTTTDASGTSAKTAEVTQSAQTGALQMSGVANSAHGADSNNAQGNANSADSNNAQDSGPPEVPFGTRAGPSFERFAQPEYPPAARRQGLSGQVLVLIMISSTGTPERVEVMSAAHDILGQAARKALRSARFHPFTHDGIAMACWTVVPIRFTLQ